MEIDPAIFGAVSSGLGFLGTMWTGYLAYRIRVKTLDTELALARLHDCFDEHRTEVKAATVQLNSLAGFTHEMAVNTLVMHGQNQAAIAETNAVVENLASEVAHNAAESVPSGGTHNPG